MKRYFGTDGVRGVANTELTCTMAFELGRIAVELLGPLLVIGRDTRKSGVMLESALVAGITSAGGDVLLADIVPTPAVALLVREFKASGGVVISASHNAPEYNGIKFFDAEGFKLTSTLENTFEERLQAAVAGEPRDEGTPLTGAAIGSASRIEDAAERYIAHAVATVQAQGLDFAGLKVAVDCGHGAAHATTPEALRRLGAAVTVINTSFDGNDINVGCGSTQLEPLRKLVATTGADMGIAHDGDADRMLALDASGAEIDGDFIEAICAKDLLERGLLRHNTVVSTVMCNLGFTVALQQLGIEVIQTAVGDSNVLAALRAGGLNLGGEQSGHTIFLDHNSTGDGLVSALQLLAALRRSGKTLAEAAQVMTKYPQVLININVADKTGLATSDTLHKAIDAAQARLQDSGRVLVRASGTEPLVRVMVEAANEELAQELATQLAQVVQQELG
ncbi:MAG: phosphoglucosamine mutase [Coriobacteriales bacterium]|nr:phosphoglucosamine mutase [Coriobacteriales bacterium]